MLQKLCEKLKKGFRIIRPFLIFCTVLFVVLTATGAITITGINGRVVEAEVWRITYRPTGDHIYWVTYRPIEDERVPPVRSGMMRDRRVGLAEVGDTILVRMNTRFIYNNVKFRGVVP
jgi:hypothetical protein